MPSMVTTLQLTMTVSLDLNLLLKTGSCMGKHVQCNTRCNECLQLARAAPLESCFYIVRMAQAGG